MMHFAYEEDSLSVARKPFPHFVGFLPTVSRHREDIESQIQSRVTWKLHQESFFSQWENSCAIEGLPGMSGFYKPDWLLQLREIVEESLDCVLAPVHKISLLRLDPGQSIGIHNDSPKLGFETHRVLIYLTDFATGFEGGELVLFSSRDPRSAEMAYKPAAGMMFGFESSNSSYHAVMPVTVGSRMAIQYYFWHVGNRPEVADLIRDRLATSLHDWDKYKPAMDAYQNIRNTKELQLSHGDTTLAGHLAETSALLHGFGADECVCLAGLVHSVEGTRNFMARGSLKDILGDHDLFEQIAEVVRAFANIKDNNDLNILMNANQDLGHKVLEIWWANVLASKSHITFSKQRFAEEREVFITYKPRLAKLAEFLEEIYS